MADNSTVNNIPDGFDDAVTVLRQVLSRDADLGQLVYVALSRGRGAGWLVEAQSASFFHEIERIEMLRDWAQALNGELVLSEPHIAHHRSTRFHWRQLTAKATIAGIAVEIWGHVDEHEMTDAEQAPELVAAHA
jgi:hypothetical protein